MNHQLANLDFRDMVVVSGDRVITTSRKVAAYFDKQHHHIIQKIEKLDCSDEFLTSNFSRVTYEHKGNQYVEYEISKDGAMYIIMSFTGKKAAAIKEAFIKAFNWMRDRLMEMAHSYQREHNELMLEFMKEPEHKVEAKDLNGMPVDNRQGTITVSASGLQVGDAFTIAGVNSVHQITKDTTGQPQVFRVLAVSGTTVTISPKILPPDNADVASRPYANVDANAASSAAITILNKNAAPANLFWADGSVELMYGKLAFPTGQGPQVMTATTEQGATLIMSYAFDHIKGVTTARFTTLYGCSVLVPEYTGIVIAGQ